MYEQADVPMEEAVEITVFTALYNAGVAYEDFSPEQMDVIYSVAESGGELEDLLNPEFPPEQMQLIADVQNRTDAISRAAAEEALEPLTQQPMTPAEVNHARRQHNLPLDSGAETEQPVQPKQEPMNFRITDDDLGAGGPKTKYGQMNGSISSVRQILRVIRCRSATWWYSMMAVQSKPIMWTALDLQNCRIFSRKGMRSSSVMRKASRLMQSALRCRLSR